MKRLIYLFLVAGILCASVWADTRHVVTQSRSTDCGPAALATLLNYYLDVPASEDEVLRASDYRRDRGTSLLGLEKAATDKGCAAGSFLMDFVTLHQQMATYPTPVIVRTLNPEPHFSVLLGFDADYVYLADPGAGNIVLTRDAFLKRWYLPGGARQGFVFVAAAPGQRVNTDRVRRTVGDLRRSLYDVQSTRLSAVPFGR